MFNGHNITANPGYITTTLDSETVFAITGFVIKVHNIKEDQDIKNVHYNQDFGITKFIINRVYCLAAYSRNSNLCTSLEDFGVAQSKVTQHD